MQDHLCLGGDLLAAQFDGAGGYSAIGEKRIVYAKQLINAADQGVAIAQTIPHFALDFRTRCDLVGDDADGVSDGSQVASDPISQDGNALFVCEEPPSLCAVWVLDADSEQIGHGVGPCAALWCGAPVSFDFVLDHGVESRRSKGEALEVIGSCGFAMVLHPIEEGLLEFRCPAEPSTLCAHGKTRAEARNDFNRAGAGESADKRFGDIFEEWLIAIYSLRVQKLLNQVAKPAVFIAV